MSSFIIIHFLSHVPMPDLPMCWNQNYYTQITFWWLNHAEKTPLSLSYWLCVKYKNLLDVLTFLWLIKSTWGWKLYVAKLWTVLHMCLFIQAKSNVWLFVRTCSAVCSADVVFSFKNQVTGGGQNLGNHSTVWINKGSLITARLSRRKMPH